MMFADISGFTDLSGEYQHLDNGASKLSTVLNFYLGIMVQEILSHHGDILKYAGDAFLAMFKIDPQSAQNSYQTTIQNAIDASIIIQKSCRNFMTEVGVVLNVKIAISCGEVHFSIVGDEILSHYVIVGEPVWQVKGLQNHISAGDILISQSAWFFVQEALYTYQHIREHRCFNITGFRDQMNVLRQQYEAISAPDKIGSIEARSNFSGSTRNHNLSYDPFSYSLHSEEFFAIRSAINFSGSFTDARKSLRRFIIPPLLNAIDLGDNVETLTEMRSCVVIFVNFVVPMKDPYEICKITDLVFRQLNR
jgi:adenylate cyclase 10